MKVLTFGFWKDNLKLRFLEDTLSVKMNLHACVKGLLLMYLWNISESTNLQGKDSSVHLIYWSLDLYLLRFLFCLILLFTKLAQGLEFTEEFQGVFHGCEFASTTIHTLKNLSKTLGFFNVLLYFLNENELVK